MEPKELVKKLQRIHDLHVDSRKGYNETSDRIEYPKLKAFLSNLSLQRAPMKAHTDGGIQTLAPGTNHHEVTIKGNLHRTWMDVRNALSTTDNANVLKECERGEKHLLEQYDDVLKEASLADVLRRPVMDQRTTVQSNLNTIATLRISYEAVEN